MGNSDHYFFRIANCHICWNNEKIYRNNGLKHQEQKNRIITNFISIMGSSLFMFKAGTSTDKVSLMMSLTTP